MKYETPELVELTPAINAIQSAKANPGLDSQPPVIKDGSAAYEDWE